MKQYFIDLALFVGVLCAGALSAGAIMATITLFVMGKTFWGVIASIGLFFISFHVHRRLMKWAKE
jgi:energy-converting hydrogenase Eha subunit B